MTNYLLSIDPSIKNTGFTLWEKTKRISECEVNYNEIEYIYKWKPIWIKSFSFKKFNNDEWEEFKHAIYRDYYWETNLIMERGIFNAKYGKGKETLDNLRGFIAAQFNKLITKNMLISPNEWQNWYFFKYQSNLLYFIIFKQLKQKNKKWNKDLSIKLAKQVIKEQGWNITVNNHDEADSLLIGWYYLNKGINNANSNFNYI